MAFDGEIKEMLDLMASLELPSLGEGTPGQARQSFRALTVAGRKPEQLPSVKAVETLTVDGGEGPRAARLYRPEDAEEAPPLLVFFHGGGFVIGDLETHDLQARRLCRDVGALVLSVDYRLAPEAPFPAALEDCLAATRQAFVQAQSLGADPARVVVAGDSAGGNLAAVVAQQLRDAGGPIPAAQLLIYPVTDSSDRHGRVHASRRENAEGYMLTLADMHWFEDHYAGDTDRADPRLSPLHGELAGLAPAVVVTAEYDPLRDEGEAYARALAGAGVTVRSRRFDGLIHGFFGLGPVSAACDRAVTETCAMLRELLETQNRHEG